MTQTDFLIDLFRNNGNKVTLGQIMKTNLGAEYRARMTDLRRKGYEIELKYQSRKNPSENMYVMREPQVACQIEMFQSRDIDVRSNGYALH